MSSWKAGCASVALIAVALGGCRLPSGDDKSEGNVVRYVGQEVATTGAFVLSNEISVRRAADPGAETIQVLRPGTSVQQKAEFSGFTLLSWSGPDGSEQTGWVPTETAKAEANAPAQPAAAGPAINLPNKVQPVQPLPQPLPTPTVATDKCTGGKVFDGTSCKCPASTSWDGSSCVDAAQANCTGGKVFDGTSCKCPASTSWNGSSCVDAAQSCTGGKVWNGSACACPASTSWDGSTCVAAAQTCTGGKVWNGSACACPATTAWDGSTCVRRKISL